MKPFPIIATIQKQHVRCIEHMALAPGAAYYDPLCGTLYYSPTADLQVVLFTFNLTAKDIRMLHAMNIDPR